MRHNNACDSPDMYKRYRRLAWVKEIYPDGRIRIRTHARDDDAYVDLDALSVKWIRRKLAEREGVQRVLALD